jgi:hypothetical protein
MAKRTDIAPYRPAQRGFLFLETDTEQHIVTPEEYPCSGQEAPTEPETLQSSLRYYKQGAALRLLMRQAILTRDEGRDGERRVWTNGRT